MKKTLIIVLITIMLICLCGCSPKENDNNQVASVDCIDFSNYLINETNIYKEDFNTNSINDTFPNKYDLRDLGIVTPVKNQNPWSACWGFAAIAAAETSILSDFNITYENASLDLSELQLIWFSKSHIVDENDSQYGEGIYVEGNSSPLSYGGLVYTATSLFSSGTGVISEDSLPYKGINGNTDGSIYNYSANDDWSVDDKYRYIQVFELIESNILPSTIIRDENDNYLGYNEYGTQCIKKELLSGKAVSICYHADNYLPGTNNEPKYINTNDNKWTHYTYDDSEYNHAVTIVGYDDSISRYDFLDHTNENGDPCFPEGDGAWICKNSWGAETESFPNYGLWGIKNEEGLSTGYFYLSYYDHSLYAPESFRFSIVKGDKDYIVDQYDYLQSKGQECWYSSDNMKMSNVFKAERDENLYAISCETNVEKSEATVNIYLLNDNNKNPEDGVLLYSSRKNYDYAGYHRIQLEEPISIKQGDRYSVVVSERFNVDDEDYYGVFVDRQNSKECALQVSSSLDENNDDVGLIYGVGIVNPNESYIFIDSVGGWCDWHDVTEVFKTTSALKYDTFDNFPIKSYADFE